MSSLDALRESRIAGILLWAYLYGLALGVLWLGWSAIWGELPRNLAWWKLLLAPLGIGVAAIALQALAEFLGNGFGVEPSESKAMRTIGKGVLFVVVLFVVFGWPMLQMSRA